MKRPPPRSTLFPYPTLFRSAPEPPGKTRGPVVHDRHDSPDRARPERDDPPHSPALADAHDPPHLEREVAAEQECGGAGREPDALRDTPGEVLDDVGHDERQTGQGDEDRRLAPRHAPRASCTGTILGWGQIGRAHV